MGFFDRIKNVATETSQKVSGAVSGIKVEDITTNLKFYEKYFSESDLLDKIKKFGKAIGATILYPVLLLFNLLKSRDIDLKKKGNDNRYTCICYSAIRFMSRRSSFWILG